MFWKPRRKRNKNSEELLSTFCMSDAHFPHACKILCLIFTTALGNVCYYYHHFTVEKVRFRELKYVTPS